MKFYLPVFYFAIYFLVSLQGEPQCSCYNGCDNTGTTFPGSDGKIENVAYGKSANVSTGEDISPACAAVNGRTGTVWRCRVCSGTNCIHTDDRDYSAWWQVDLGRNYTVTDITVYRATENYGSPVMSGMSVFVDNQLCYSFPNRTTANTAAIDALPEQSNISCATPLTGRHVRFQKHGEDQDNAVKAYLIHICEVQVWACKDGLYGAQCDQTCSGHCKDDDICDNYYGTCPTGCSTGYTGADCRCGHCKDDADCDVTTLTCPSGCDKGWDTVFCNQSCPAGTHGYGCGEQCGQCADSDTCNTVTGLCPNGCQPGWKGDNCKQECDAGKYGNDCSSSCGHCNHGDVCHHINGTCPSGCAAGFDPSDPLCETFCGNSNYGEQCSEPCGYCSGGDQCDPFTGTCVSCYPQFQPPFCKACTGKSWGGVCDLICSTGCGGDGSCEQDTGRCVEGCKAGYLPGQSGVCNDVCEEGKYGEGCSMECGKCTHSCRHNDGLCIGGCVDGYAGPYCAQTSESSPSLAGPVAGAVLGTLCVIALSFLVGLLIRRSRKRSSSETASPPPTSANQSAEPGAPVGLNSQAALQEETGGACVTEAEEGHYYDELQTPDDSDIAVYLTPVFKGQQGKGRNSHTYQNSALHTSDTGKDYYNM